MRSQEEAFVEGWIADHVKPEGYDATGDAAEELAARCADDASFSREQIEAEIGPLKDRMARAIEAETEAEMMKRDGRSGSRSVELPIGAKKETLDKHS